MSEAPQPWRLRMLSQLPWRTYRLVRCRSERYCEFCGLIDLGTLYYDGGPGRRACQSCVQKAEVTR